MVIDSLDDLLAVHQQKQLLRQRIPISNRNGTKIKLDGKWLINFSHNDYLGIADHPQVKAAFIEGVEQYGVGSSASPVLAGFYQANQELEEKFARFMQADRAILFNSGYHANLGVFTSLANRHCFVLADKLCHASILDGVQLSRAKLLRFRHQDLLHLETLLKKIQQPCLIVTESIFGMEGAISPIDQVANLAQRYQATLIVDDAHGVGVLGQQGRGIREYYQLTQTEIPCLISPLGKAFGSFGALVSGTENIINTLTQFSRTYLYSTALPPAVAAASLAALQIIEEEGWRRDKLASLAKQLIQQAWKWQLPLMSQALTPIKSILIEDISASLEIQQQLLHNGFYVSCIRPPTVPAGTSRIKISINCLHEEEEITRLFDYLGPLYEKFRKTKT